MEKVQVSADVARFLKSKSKTRSVLSWTGPQNHTQKKHILQGFFYLCTKAGFELSCLNSQSWTVSLTQSMHFWKMKLKMINCTCLHISLGDPPLDTIYRCTEAVKICLCWNQHKRFWNQYKSVTKPIMYPQFDENIVHGRGKKDIFQVMTETNFLCKRSYW